MRIVATGVLTPWGEGIAALPADAREAAGGRAVLAMARPPIAGDRFRRATRECLIAVGAVDAMLRAAGLARGVLRGPGTALVYVTAGAYGASNVGFIAPDAAGGGALHFPYTAPSAVPGEVTIEFGITGRYVTLIGGAATTLDALWHAGSLLDEGACERVVVLAVETFDECAGLWQRGRWLVGRPLVEAAACVLLEAGGGPTPAPAGAAASALERTVRRRAGETLACGPLIGLALARETGEDAWSVTGRWRGHAWGFAGHGDSTRTAGSGAE